MAGSEGDEKRREEEEEEEGRRRKEEEGSRREDGGPFNLGFHKSVRGRGSRDGGKGIFRRIFINET